MKKLGTMAILGGVALLVYNLFNWEPPRQVLQPRYYGVDARIGLALGAVLLVAGILMFKRTH